MIVFFLLLRIKGLQNTNEHGIGPWFSIPYQTRNCCTQKRGEGVRKCQFLRKVDHD